MLFHKVCGMCSRYFIPYVLTSLGSPWHKMGKSLIGLAVGPSSNVFSLTSPEDVDKIVGEVKPTTSTLGLCQAWLMNEARPGQVFRADSALS